MELFHFPTYWDSDYSGHLHDRALNWHLPLACLPWTWLVNHYFCLTWIESHLILFSRMFLMYEYCRVPLHLVCYWRQWITNWRPTLCVAVLRFGDRNLNCGTVSSVTTLSCDWSLVARNNIWVKFRFVELQSQGQMRFECMVLSSAICSWFEENPYPLMDNRIQLNNAFIICQHLDSQIGSVHQRKQIQSQPNTVNCLLIWRHYTHRQHVIWIKRKILPRRTHRYDDVFRCVLHSHVLSDKTMA